MKLSEIATRIGEHLKRSEADASINKSRSTHSNTKPYFMVNAWAAGRYVGIKYISYQGTSNLTKDEALAYLA